MWESEQDELTVFDRSYFGMDTIEHSTSSDVCTNYHNSEPSAYYRYPSDHAGDFYVHGKGLLDPNSNAISSLSYWHG